MTTPIELEVPFGFSLSAAAEFYAGAEPVRWNAGPARTGAQRGPGPRRSDPGTGFAPMGGAARKLEQSLQLVVRLDGTFEAVSAKLKQSGTKLTVEVEGTRDTKRLMKQLSRMLGLGVDGRAWAAVGEVDPVLGAVKRHFPGFFTAGFPSPYEAGLGGVLSQRSSVKQAAAIRKALSLAHGDEVGGLRVVPSPEQLLKVRSFAGISETKLETLHGLARATLDGVLDAERLNALPPEQALEELQALRGIGPWTASHMLLRGCSAQDALPLQEPRVLRAFTHAYQRPESDFVQCAEAWRPFRMWASIVLVRELARVGGWAAVPSDFKRRGRAA